MEPSLRQQAQQGHPQALEALINQALSPQGLRVRVQKRGRQLVIYCDARAQFSAQAWTRFIERGFERLGYRPRQTIWLDGGQWQVAVNWGRTTQVSPAWLSWVLGVVGASSLGFGGWLAYQWQPPATIAQATREPQPTPVPTPSPTVITIKAVGDVILGTDFPDHRLHPEPRRLLAQVQAALAGADVVFGNLEGAITRHPYSSKQVNGYSVFAFRMPPSYAQIRKEAGFTIFNLANNHTGATSVCGTPYTICKLLGCHLLASEEKFSIKRGPCVLATTMRSFSAKPGAIPFSLTAGWLMQGRIWCSDMAPTFPERWKFIGAS